MMKNTLMACILGIALSLLSACDQTSKYVTDIDGRSIVIVDTSGQDRGSQLEKVNGVNVFTHDSGNCKVRLEGLNLTVNGNRYAVPEASKSISIEDGRVSIDGDPVVPKSK